MKAFILALSILMVRPIWAHTISFADQVFTVQNKTEHYSLKELEEIRSIALSMLQEASLSKKNRERTVMKQLHALLKVVPIVNEEGDYTAGVPGSRNKNGVWEPENIIYISSGYHELPMTFAAQILIHESVHLLGSEDECLADEMLLLAVKHSLVSEGKVLQAYSKDCNPNMQNTCSKHRIATRNGKKFTSYSVKGWVGSGATCK